MSTRAVKDSRSPRHAVSPEHAWGGSLQRTADLDPPQVLCDRRMTGLVKLYRGDRPETERQVGAGRDNLVSWPTAMGWFPSDLFKPRVASLWHHELYVVFDVYVEIGGPFSAMSHGRAPGRYDSVPLMI